MKRISAVLLALIMICASFGFFAYGSVGETAQNGGLKPFYSLQTVSSRDMLTSSEKEIFDAVTALEAGAAEVTLSSISGEDITYEVFPSINLERLFYAVLMDCPHLFWIEGMSITYENLRDNNSNGVFDSGDTAALKLSLPRNTVYDSVENIYSYIASTVAAQNFSQYNTRYELLLAVHDLVADAVSLDSAAENDESVSNEVNDRAHNVVGALLDGLSSCEGYAKTFKLFCNYLKIPCITLNDGAHMWNGVFMDDGNWYYVDVANDDIDDERSYGFFLVGSETPDALDSDSAFYETHVSLSDSATPDVVFSQSAYSGAGEAYTAFSATFNSAAVSASKVLKRSVYQKNEPVYYNGVAVNAEFNATGDKFTVKSGASFANEEWTLVLLGDVNGDGVCDSTDYTLLRTRVLSGENGFIGGIFDMAGDMNCDGYLDVLDMMVLERCVSGSNRNIEVI